MHVQSIETAVRRAVADKCGEPLAAVECSLRLPQLGLSKRHVVELLLGFDAQFALDPPASVAAEVARMHSVQCLVDYVQRHREA